MTVRKKKKAQPKKPPLPFVVKETHDGDVRVSMIDPMGFLACCILDRDVALVFAIKLLISSTGLSAAEVRKALSK